MYICVISSSSSTLVTYWHDNHVWSLHVIHHSSLKFKVKHVWIVCDHLMNMYLILNLMYNISVDDPWINLIQEGWFRVRPCERGECRDGNVSQQLTINLTLHTIHLKLTKIFKYVI